MSDEIPITSGFGTGANERLSRWLRLIAKLRADHLSRPSLAPELVRAVSAELPVARVGWWRIVHSPEPGLELEAGWWGEALHTATPSQFLSRSKYPAYFEALRRGVPVRADDALHDPRTRELANDFLIPDNVGAVLDAPVVRSGVLLGVLCMDHEGGPRRWEDDEVQFAMTLAAILAQRDAERETNQVLSNLRDSERQFRALFDSSPDLVHSLSPSGHLHYANAAWRTTLGYSDDELEGLNLMHLAAPEERSRALGLLTEALRGNVVRDAMLRLVNRDGSIVPMSGTLVPHREGMNVVRVHGFFRDLSVQRPQEERALAEAYARIAELEAQLGEQVDRP